jgi:phosphoglycolate phosphatase
MHGMARHRLFLFDIDGTLMLSGGAGARALGRALLEVFGLPNALEGVRLHGQTDPQIVADALERAGRTQSATAEELDRARELYLTYLEREIQTSEKARVLPGVQRLLEHLAGISHVKLALLTGNIEPGARIKLSRFDLNRFFVCGGFGSDSRVRRELVPIALDRARAQWKVELAASDVVVIGDTEKDVDCGRFAGARTLAVATGSVSEEDLKNAGPDLVFPSLEDTHRVADALLGL